VRLRRGARYRFFTVAVDRAGNREAAPKLGDVRITVPR
jgi:serine protease